jgi:phosphomevalonate kinase
MRENNAQHSDNIRLTPAYQKKDKHLRQLEVIDEINERVIGGNSKQKDVESLDLIPVDKPENKEILLSVLRHFNIINKEGKAISPPQGQAQFINGIIDALKQKKILAHHPHTTLHKLLCKEIKTVYIRASLRKNKNYSAYNRGLEETISYLNK